MQLYNCSVTFTDIIKVCTHEGTGPCDYSPEEFTRRDWSQGLVPLTVHTKRFEQQVTETCPKNFNWFEFQSWGPKLVPAFKFEAKMTGSHHGTCPRGLLQGLDLQILMWIRYFRASRRIVSVNNLFRRPLIT